MLTQWTEAKTQQETPEQQTLCLQPSDHPPCATSHFLPHGVSEQIPTQIQWWLLLLCTIKTMYCKPTARFNEHWFGGRHAAYTWLVLSRWKLQGQFTLDRDCPWICKSPFKLAYLEGIWGRDSEVLLLSVLLKGIWCEAMFRDFKVATLFGKKTAC